MAIGCRHGFTITFAGGGSYNLTSVGDMTETGDEIEATHHGTTTWRQFIRGCLKTHEPVEVGIQLDTVVGLPAILQTPQLITITFPKSPGESAGAAIAGTGFIVSRSFLGGDAGSTELKGGTVTIRFDGIATPPAFSVATTT